MSITDVEYDLFVYQLAFYAAFACAAVAVGLLLLHQHRSESVMLAYGAQVKADYEKAFADNSARLEAHYGEALRISTVRRRELELVVANVAETWTASVAAGAEAMKAQTVEAKRAQNRAREAHRLAAEAAIAATADPASRTPVPSSRVVVIRGAKEASNG